MAVLCEVEEDEEAGRWNEYPTILIATSNLSTEVGKMVCMAWRVARARGVAVGVSTEVRGRSDQQHGKEESEVHDFATVENLDNF